jgi:hypothetical protein
LPTPLFIHATRNSPRFAPRLKGKRFQHVIIDLSAASSPAKFSFPAEFAVKIASSRDEKSQFVS